MDIVNEEFKGLKQKKLLLNILSELALVVGGALFFRDNSSAIIQIIGIFIFAFGIGIWLKAVSFRNTKKYRQLEKDEGESESLKEIINNFGLGTTIAGFIFIIFAFLGSILILYVFLHSWIKVMLYFFAYELVSDLRSYYKLKLNS